MRRAVFLDRDGTIAEHVPYMRRPEEFRLLPGAGKAIALLNAAGYRVVVITNQSGVARGYLTAEALEQIHERMREELAAYGAWIDAIYCCLHHPDDGCACRKPRPGLLLRAAEELGLSLRRSVMVGDQELDVAAGQAAGAKGVLVKTGPVSNGPPPEGLFRPDFQTDSLLEVVRWLLTRPRAAEPARRRLQPTRR